MPRSSATARCHDRLELQPNVVVTLSNRMRNDSPEEGEEEEEEEVMSLSVMTMP